MESIKEFLKNETDINVFSIAHKMWPNNKGAHVYLSKKLNGLDNRVFTPKDAELALKVLKELGVKINELKV
jgi:hypothetical protein